MGNAVAQSSIFLRIFLPEQNGNYLAHPEDTQDFCNGIVKLLEDEPLRQNMSENCRDIALKEYSLDLPVYAIISAGS
jgi:glycosyltransferase involved in cell wall biosynthesis